MFYDELHRPVIAWPLLIAGPMVRRVTEESVAVFIATRTRVETVTLTVYDDVGLGRRALATSTRDTVKLGAFLHVCVIEATGLALRPGRLYGYDIRLQTAFEDTDLYGLGLLSDPVPLGYLPDLLPGFVLPGPLDTLRVVHASCRRSHGSSSGNPVDPDVLPLVDRLIQERREDPWNRPQQLFLTGDQIYADDVPAALLAALTSAGTTMLGWGTPETIPDRAGAPVAPDVRGSGGPLVPGDRGIFLNDQGVRDRPAGMKPADDFSANHLLFFHEWCAMYLFAWSPEPWLPTETVTPGIHERFPNVTQFYLPAAEQAWGDSPDTTTPTLVYAENLAFVRRALANVATYMIFDDHEVTDDWNLNAAVSEQMRGGPTGRRLMRNALAAYAVFQHWGNAPDAFAADKPGGRLLGLLDAASGTPVIGSPGQETAADDLLDVGVQPLGPDRVGDRMRWDYELVFADHRVIVLDTRTWRGYPLGPRTLTDREIADAESERTGITVDWGPEALDAIAAIWQDAAGAVPDLVSLFLLSGADLLTACAALGRIGKGRTAPYETQAQDTLDAAKLLVEAVRNAPGTFEQSWAPDALGDASDALASPSYAPGGDLVESVLRVATAMYEAVFVLREARAALLAEVGPASLDEVSIDYLIAVETLTKVLEHAAAFLQGAVHSLPRAARRAELLVLAWSDLAFDSASALWAEDAQAAGVALWEAAVAAAPPQADLAANAAAFAFPDPVWGLVRDAERSLNAELISAEALVFQVQERVADERHGRAVNFVVSAAPPFGHALVEFGQRRAIQLGYGPGDPHEYNENEPWSGNMPALDRFLDALTPLGSAVFLSGDVHYAFSSVTDYVGEQGRPARFVQLTSSPAKNPEWKAEWVAAAEEVRDTSGDARTMALDFLGLLPTQQEWDGFSPEVQALLPSREQALEAIAEQRDAYGEGSDPAGIWSDGGLDMKTLRDLLADTGTSAWDEFNQDGAIQAGDGLDGVLEWWEDPVHAFVGDRVQEPSLAEGGTLALGDALGANVGSLPEQRTTILRDRRGAERAGDSPGLRARLDRYPTMAPVVYFADRTTVAHCNIGVISTRTTAAGRFISHDLHWFPFDTLDARPSPDLDGASFRDDWIITRHCAGLILGTESDGSLAGACGGDPAVTPVGLRIDVTSPGQSESGPSRIHAITITPAMPDILVEVQLVGATAAAAAAQVSEVRLVCSYHEGNRTDDVYLPGPAEDGWFTLEAGRTTWRPSFPEFCGGELIVHARATFGTVPLIKETPPGSHLIWGRNPAKADLRTQAAAGTNIEVVFHRESSFTQFSASPRRLGPFVEGPAPVLLSPPPSNSFGAGQLDTPRPRSRELWNWRLNVIEAVARLNAFRAAAVAYQSEVQRAHPEATDFTTDQLDLEMWARYNSGRHYHDWDPATGRWVRQPSQSTGVTKYAPELLEMRRRVDAGDLPSDW